MWIAEGDICEACLQSTTGQCPMHTTNVTVTINPGVTLPAFTLTPFPFVSQGWQCPCCRHVMAPHITMCPVCPAQVYLTTTTSLASS